MTEHLPIKVSVEWVPLGSLKPAGIEPSLRLKNVKNIRSSIEKHGFWPWKPILVTEDLTIGDGHRRWTAARDAKLDIVPIMRVPGKTASEIFGETNSYTRPITGREWAQATTQGYKPEDIPDPQRAREIAGILRVGGQELLDKLSAASKAVHVYMVAENLARYLGREGDDWFIKRAIEWAMQYGMQKSIKAIVTSKTVDKTLLETAILDNRRIETYVAIRVVDDLE